MNARRVMTPVPSTCRLDTPIDDLSRFMSEAPGGTLIVLALTVRRRLARLAPIVLIAAAALILVRAFGWPDVGGHSVHPAAHHVGVVHP